MCRVLNPRDNQLSMIVSASASRGLSGFNRKLITLLIIPAKSHTTATTSTPLSHSPDECFSVAKDIPKN
jgi:hypothetical protein